MKKIVLVLVGILLLTGCHKTTSNSSIKFKGIYIDNIDNYIVYKDNDKLGVKTIEGKKIIEPKYQELVSTKDHHSLIFKNDELYILVDNKGNEVIKSKNKIDIVTDIITKRDYYYVDKSLYNDKYQLLIDNLNIELPIVMKNGFLIISNDHVIDIRTRRYMNISFLDAYKDYTAFISGGSYLIYDHEHETWISCKNYQKLINGAHFYDDVNSLYISNEKGKVNGFNDLVDPEHLLEEYSIDTKSLKVVRKSDNKDILKGPVGIYYVSNNKKIYYFDNHDYSSNNNSESEAVAIFSGKTVKTIQSKMVGNYLVNVQGIYNSQGKKIDANCTNNALIYIGEHYMCPIGGGHEILDSDLKLVETYYKTIECEEDICYVSNNKDLYGIYRKNKEIVKPIYKSIDIRKDYYIGVIDDKTFELIYYKDIKDS